MKEMTMHTKRISLINALKYESLYSFLPSLLFKMKIKTLRIWYLIECRIEESLREFWMIFD